MKKFLSPEPSGGVPITNELFYILQSEPFKATLALYASVADSWVVSGCNVTYTTGATTCDMTSGYVFLAGELREVDAISSVFPFYIIADTDVYDVEQFGNGAVQNIYVNKKATITTVQPTSGSFLVVNPTIKDDTVSKRIKPLLTNDLISLLTTETQNRINGDNILRQALVDESTTRNNADVQLQNNINTLAATVNTKQNRITTRIPWQDIAVTNTAYHTVDDPNDPYRFGATGALYNRFQIMRTEDGIVHLRGYLRGNGGGTIVNSLPMDLRPKGTVQFNIPYITDGNNAYPGKVTTMQRIEIDPIGQIFHTQIMSQAVNNSGDPGALQLLGFQPWFVVDGCSYSVE